MNGVFVTGTGTGVGKTIVAAALCAALRQQGRGVMASKPLLSGMDGAPEAPWPHDHDLLALVTGEAAEDIAPLRFGPAVSPHLAARLEGVTLRIDDLVVDLRRRYEARRDSAAPASPASATGGSVEPLVVVEGAGGLLVPIDDEPNTMAALARALGLPLIIAAHPGLGTINHVLLTLEAARARALPIAGVVLTPWPAEPTVIEADNRAFLEAHAGVPVHVLGPVAEPTAAALATAGIKAGLHRLI